MAVKERVIVAMSGGVDSSTAAYLLREEGYDVVGVSLDLFDFTDVTVDRAGTCCSLDDIYDARDVCYKLGIPHYVFNFREIFEKEVIDNFIHEYAKGRTPNPCIICNDVVKFEVLLNRARMLEAKYLATGHYARIERGKDGRVRLLKGVDEKKDQSYFLYRLTRATLPHILFPCGKYRKDEVRKIAFDNGLPVDDKGESQEICFVAEKSYAEFLRERGLREDEGDIVTVKGDIVGRHRGIFQYTIGQRKGIKWSADVPYYVVHIDRSNNRVIIGPEEYLFSLGAIVEKVNLLLDHAPGEIFEAKSKVRYRAGEVSSKIALEGDIMRVFFDDKVKSVTPGQALVLYRGDEVIGGGVIREAIKEG